MSDCLTLRISGLGEVVVARWSMFTSAFTFINMPSEVFPSLCHSCERAEAHNLIENRCGVDRVYWKLRTGPWQTLRALE
eukprot:2814120-Rhodomonas_salina.1